MGAPIIVKVPRTSAPRLLSSDIFDTAVLRLVGRPRSAFLLLGAGLARQGLWGLDARIFAIQRAQAEATAQAEAPGGEASLADIYDELARSPFLTDAVRAMEAELDLERALIVPSAAHAAVLEEARAGGASICFISDTYLPSDFLREILGDLAGEGETVYASCEHAASKHAGTLFRQVLAMEGRDPAAVVHIGDDRIADGTMATRSGVAARLCAAPALNRYEEALERHAISTNGVSSLLAGSARVVRSTHRSKGAPRALIDVAASVAAPVLIGFVSWTLETARAAGCTRIGYVSRDGQILQAIAARLEAQRAAADRLPATYVHGGRRAWHPAGITDQVLEGEPPRWWLEEARRRRWQAPLEILGFVEADAPATIADAVRALWAQAGGSLTWGQTVERRKAGMSTLWRQQEVQAALRERGSRARSLLARYLQEHDMGTGRWALADVGWRGHSAASLNRALSEEGLTRPLHLYLGLLDPDPELTRTGDWQSYLFCAPGPDSESARFGGALTTFMEVLCTADHGSVAGFREGSDGVEPVLDQPHAAAQEWGIGEVQETVLALVDRVAPFASDLAGADPRAALREMLQLFLAAPHRAEVQAWSTFPFTDDPAGATPTDWVSRWSVRDLVRWALRGEEPRSFWREGSIAMSGAPGRVVAAARGRRLDAQRERRQVRAR